MKVLIVDDEPRAVRMLEQEIALITDPNGEPFTVTGLTNYQEALALIEREPFDVAITDMRMAGSGGGDEGLEVVQALVRRSAVAIVFTAFPEIPNCVAAMRAGAWDYIEKRPRDGADAYKRLLCSIDEACRERLRSPERSLVNPDVKWIEDNIGVLMRDYPGRAIAVLYERVIDSGDTLSEVSRRAQERFPLAKATLMFVPDADDKVVP